MPLMQHGRMKLDRGKNSQGTLSKYRLIPRAQLQVLLTWGWQAHSPEIRESYHFLQCQEPCSCGLRSVNQGLQQPNFSLTGIREVRANGDLQTQSPVLRVN